VKQDKKKVTLKKISLHDDNHHSFTFGLSVEKLLKMMTSMTAQHHFERYGKYPKRLDKSKISMRRLRDI